MTEENVPEGSVEGDWKLTDGTTPAFFNWDSGEPNDCAKWFIFCLGLNVEPCAQVLL